MALDRPYTKTTLEAARLIGQLIKLARKKRRMSESELAMRAHIARSTLQKIEKGDPSINIGLVFEAASVVGVALFDTDDSAELIRHNNSLSDQLTLLSNKSSKDDPELKDDF